ADIASLLRANLIISEIMYNPPGAGTIDGDEFEFLELRNIGTNILDLTGLSFTAGINFSFTNGTKINPGGTFLLARNPAQLAARYPGVVVNGTYTGRLDNGGETITISHVIAGQILSVTYDDRAPWPVTADGFGYSLVYTNGAYAASGQPLGTPGADGAANTNGGVVINEVLSSSTPPLRDYIELYNSTAATIDISGWYLTDDPTFPWKFRIPDGTTLGSGAYMVFDETHFNPTPGNGNSFSLSSLGDDAYLFSSSTPGQLSGYSHGFEFGGAQDAVSFGRFVNSVGEQFALQVARTPGASNSGPQVGPAVISEIHYHPRNPNDEFLELYNSGNNPVFLENDSAGATNTWQLEGLAYTFFEPAPVIPPHGYLLLVADDPDIFRARWNVPSGVEIYQYLGVLQDSGENLRLVAPDVPTTNGVPYYAVDNVRYNDRQPWPLAADGGGASLQRLDPTAYGNDPANWLAARPTPGGPRISGAGPNIVTQPQPSARTNAVGGTSSFNVTAGGPGPLFYQWRFNNDNIDDATNSTLMLQDLQLENSGQYSVVVFNAAGSAESLAATLIVRVGVSISSQPTNALVRIPPDPLAAPTTNATFAVTAASFNPPVQYQWQFNGIDIPGANGPSLTVSNVGLANEGAYTVLVSDQIGSVPAATAFLYPLVTPKIVLNPITQSAVTGQVISVSAEGTGNPLPFGWEWRRLSASIATNTVSNSRAVFYDFVNTNAPGSSIQYRLVVRNLAGQANVTFNINTLADIDADGLPDAWEAAYPDAGNPALDADLDGLSNLQEYLAGTDPTSAGSRLKLTLTADGVLSFSAVSNKTYTIQQSESLGAAWIKLTDVLARTNNRIETLSGVLGPTNRMFRAVTPRQP
ncbi:MAG TPA: lamin tail domain-containing protein, partial [Verrucomicrobiae bacterium]|nr:lamin tail domain-containing protein [Verrucomicrobiae bacterium]